MANSLALRLDRTGLAEMSCIAGVGGGVPHLTRLAHAGRPILALDGCPLHCVAACLARESIAADRHITLSDYGVRKRKHADFDPHEAEQIWPQIAATAAALADKNTS